MPAAARKLTTAKNLFASVLNSPPRLHGALWSLGGEFKTDANKFFAVVSFLAAAGISLWALRKKPDDRWLTVSLGLILGGTLGNLFDRIVFGGVRDFLCF